MSEREVAGHTITLSKQDKVLFPDDGITKGGLVDYYETVAPVMVPHVEGRPLTMERFPDGVAAQRFYQKSASKYFPEWIPRLEMAKKGGSVAHPVADSAAVLVYLANQAAITFHTGLSRGPAAGPDQLIFDLDPSDDDFDLVRRTAIEVADLLETTGLVPFVKTTGSRGLHVLAPLDGGASFEETHGFAHAVAMVLAERHPDDLTTEFYKEKRAGRLFLDIGRNTYAQHAVAAYSVRPKPAAPVSTPIDWGEVDGDLTPHRWTLANVPERLARRACPWEGLYDKARPLAEARARLGSA